MNLFKVVVLGVLTVAMLGSTSNSQVSAIRETPADGSLAPEEIVAYSPALTTETRAPGEYLDAGGFDEQSELDPHGNDKAEEVCCVGAFGCYESERGCHPGDYAVACPCPPVD